MATGQMNTVANGKDTTREEIGETHKCTVINKSHETILGTAWSENKIGIATAF